VAEDIIITPASGKIDFYDSASTVTTWVIETGTLKFKSNKSIKFADKSVIKFI
jgi:hypothetical protein